MRNRKQFDVNFNNGVITILESMKTLIYGYDETLIETIGFENDFVYGEPLLYGFFALDSSTITMDQILFGYLDKDKRKTEITVYSDEFGVVYLPQIGYFHLKEKDQHLTLKITNEKYAFFNGFDQLDHQFEELVYLKSAPTVEVIIHSNPLVKNILEKWGKIEEETVARGNNLPIYREHLENNYNDFLKTINTKGNLLYEKLDDAFSILKAHTPDEFDRIVQTTRKVICYDNPFIRGFASKMMQGAVFISVDDNSDKVFFLDELVHQSSHGVFNLMTLPIDEYLKIDPGTPLRDLSSTISQKEERSIYDAYHGLYTITSVIYALLPVYRNHKFNWEQTYNLLGRISMHGIMIRTGIHQINKEEVLTEDGIEIFDFLFEESDELIAANPDIFDKFDFSNQPYTYSFEKFKELNSHLMVN